MKRLILISLSLVLFLGILVPVFAIQKKTIKLVIDNPIAEIDGEEVILDVPPTIINGRTLVPLRFIAESFGAEIVWDGKTRTITLTVPDLKSMEAIIENLKAENDQLKAEKELTAKENENLKKKNEDLIKLNSEFKDRIAMMDTLITKLEDQIKELLDENKTLKAENKELKEKLKEGNSTEEEDNKAPVITVKNLKTGDILNENNLALEITIDDDSKIVFSRVKINSIVLSETLGEYSEIIPSKLITGNYLLTVEAIDGNGNHGETIIEFAVEHEKKKEPIRLILDAVNVKNMMDGGKPGSNSDDSTVIPGLTGKLVNKSMASIEVIKVDVFDSDGNLFELMPGVNCYDIIKEQMGLPKYMVVKSKDEYSFLCAISSEEQDIKPEEYFNGFNVKVTLFDSVRKLEFIKTIRYTS